MTPLVDIGANLTNKAFRGDVEIVLRRAKEAGVGAIVITGTSVTASVAARDLARRVSPVRLVSTAGIHPHHASTYGPLARTSLLELCESPEVVAVGECGLDYDRNFSSPEQQRRAFEGQLELAAEVDKPVFLHERDAHEDFVAILSRHRAKLRAAVVHCFTGRRAQLESYLALDLHIGITGWICDERGGRHLEELVRLVPKDRLMIETDAPYILPRDLPAAARPKDRRNEPALLPHVLRAVARARGEAPEELAVATTRTARAFFGVA
jgi:TatD DNase family protein